VSTVDPFVGTSVAGRYEIREHAYDEALGRVYVGWDATEARLVHVKVLSPEFAEDSAKFRRFGREITASFMVTHPHTVEVVDFGDSDGMLYLVLEYLRAHEASKEMVRGPLDPLRVASIVTQVATAIGAAHQEGIVHRNLCPDTILLLDNVDGGDFAKVRDFGMSKLESSEQTGGGLTTANERLGVAAYTAPEYLSTGEYHLKGDLYALGAVAWHMLVGRPPYEGDIATVLTDAMAGPPPAPSTLRDGVPEWLDKLVIDLMARNPTDRPGAYKVQQRVEEALDGPVPIGTVLPLDADGNAIAPPATSGGGRGLVAFGVAALVVGAGILLAFVLVVGIALSILLLQLAS
jgi:serine/threonine-protein kinase